MLLAITLFLAMTVKRKWTTTTTLGVARTLFSSILNDDRLENTCGFEAACPSLHLAHIIGESSEDFEIGILVLSPS